MNELRKVLKLMEIRLSLWEAEREKSKNDVCLVASISDIKDDIRTVKRAIRLHKDYMRDFGDMIEQMS